MTKFQDVKVVILGQDPYAQNGYATGLAFATANGKITGSLRNIFSRIENINLEDVDTSLEGWARQGVFLLNPALTTEIGKSRVHFDKWKTFTSTVIKILENKPAVKFLLWGKDAQKSVVKRDSNVLLSSHPSPRSAYRTDAPFMKCDHFRQTSVLIDWTQTK